MKLKKNYFYILNFHKSKWFSFVISLSISQK